MKSTKRECNATVWSDRSPGGTWMLCGETVDDVMACIRVELEQNFESDSGHGHEPLLITPMLLTRREIMTGVEMIAAERQRQIDEECWSNGHDDQHKHGELAKAAEAYLHAMEAVPYEDHNRVCTGFVLKPRTQCPANPWPWEYSWWKPSADPVRNLVKAGALIAAEIDRLNRIE